ncbi:hypothetical protein [Streptomyces griseofuscus]
MLVSEQVVACLCVWSVVVDGIEDEPPGVLGQEPTTRAIMRPTP